jgi:hypothetical protein
MSRVLEEIDLREPADSFVSTRESAQRVIRIRHSKVKTLLEGFDPVLGSWLGRGDWRGFFAPADIRAMPLCRMVFLGR